MIGGSRVPRSRVGVVTLACSILSVLLLSGCELLTGPRFAINKVLDDLAAERLEDESRGIDLSFRFVSRTMEIEGDRATVFARGEVAGTFGGVDTECICVEAIPLERQGGQWAVRGFPLPRLAGVIEALEARREAFENRDLDAYRNLVHPEYGGDEEAKALLEARIAAIVSDGGSGRFRQEILGRTMRVERHEAIVTEHWRLIPENEAGERAPVEGRARYVLLPSEEGWRFASGLM